MNKQSDAKQGGWIEKKRRERGRRALERQLEYQEEKAQRITDTQEMARNIFLRSQVIRQRLDRISSIKPDDSILEVGSGAHGLIFGFGGNFGVGVDPLAVDYRRLFPKWQESAATLAAIGEELPFDDSSFDIVLSDNVIDHAEKPLRILDELARVLKTGGLFYFTVNAHHPVYNLASRAYGVWTAIGLKIELSAFADHTIHFTEKQITSALSRLPLRIVETHSNVPETRTAQRSSKAVDPEAILKKLFFKNALFEVIAEKL